MKLYKLPPLPQPPCGGKGRLEVEVTYEGPATVQTRLGSIPRDYSTGIGREKNEDVFFGDGAKEATNPYGGSREIWKAIPQRDSDGSPQIVELTETIVAAPKSKVGTTAKWAGLGAAAGGFVGLMGGILAGYPGAGAAIGAATVGGLCGLVGFADAAGDRVRLEWQEAAIKDYELVGYNHEVDEDEDCDSDGDCDSDYEHDFRPLFETEELGSYYRPVVVHYREGEGPAKKKK